MWTISCKATLKIFVSTGFQSRQQPGRIVLGIYRCFVAKLNNKLLTRNVAINTTNLSIYILNKTEPGSHYLRPQLAQPDIPGKQLFICPGPVLFKQGVPLS